ncbi:MAG: hypothetical protein ACK4VW_03085 [Anaerolineales bacterium]
MNREQRKVLQMVEAGQLTPQAAAYLLDLLAHATDEAGRAAEATEKASAGAAGNGSPDDPQGEMPELAPKLKRWWWLLPAGGLVLFSLGFFWLSQTSAQGWGLMCGGGLVLIALALAGLGIWASHAIWTIIEITSLPLRLEFPLPLGLIRIGLAVAGLWKAELKGAAELTGALRELKGNPLRVAIDDEEEHVQIYIG